MQPLTGLVICGGYSTRMGTDKSLLHYHGQPQRNHLYHLLEPYCEKVFISCNSDQAGTIDHNLAFITDNEQYMHTGPMAAILSAFDRHPNQALLAIGCDYPFITKENILYMVSNRDENKAAVGFYNEAVKLYEPLLCIYEKDMAEIIRNNFQQQQYALQKILQQVNAGKLYPKETRIIQSIDTVADHLAALAKLKKMQG